MISYKLLTAKPETPFKLSGFFAIVAKRAFFGLAIFKGVKTITKYSAAKKGPFDAISSSRFPRTRYPILRAVVRSENPGVPELFGEYNLPPWLR